MIAAPRQGIDVHEAIDQLRRGGFDELLHLFCEPGMRRVRPLPRVVVHRNPTRRGMVGNWRYCLEWLVEHTTADILMVCEDDVRFCRGARAAWEAVADPSAKVGFWSLYTPVRDRPLVGERPGWSVSNRGRDAWGTQAICLPRASAEILLKNEPFRTEDQLRGPTDALVADCFLKAALPCFYHNPSLVDHIGRISSVGHNWYDEHVGLDFDPEFQPLKKGTGSEREDDVSGSTDPSLGACPLSQPACRAAVITVFQPNIPLEVVSAQAEVICRFLPPGCEFVPVEVGHHALGLDEYFREGNRSEAGDWLIFPALRAALPPRLETTPRQFAGKNVPVPFPGREQLLRQLRHEAYVIFDIDCIPLAAWVIPWLVENALAGTLLGPAQRANHLSNGEHVYAGPSALAFSRVTYERLGRPSFRATDRGDVAEELTYACEAAGIPIMLLWPTHVGEPKWQLRSGLTFGHGTTFGGAIYHAFEISKGETAGMFLRKCRQVLSRAARQPDAACAAAEAGAPDAKKGTGSEPQAEIPDETDWLRAACPLFQRGSAVFHEQWYADDELKKLAEAVRATADLPGLIIEIGCWEGRSTAAIANACFPETLLAVDTWQGCPTEAPDHETVRLARERDVFATFQANMHALTRGNVEPVREDALGFLRGTSEPTKFCHVDGAHDYPSVLATLQLLIPRLVEGAVIFGHDYQTAHAGRGDLQGGVERAVRELLPGHAANGNTWSYRHCAKKS
jgi:hypothetical protein